MKKLHSMQCGSIGLNFYFPDKKRRDTLSYEKIVIDCLVKAGILPDDNYMVLPEVTRLGELDRENPRVEIYLTEWHD